MLATYHLKYSKRGGGGGSGTVNVSDTANYRVRKPSVG
jgi:hypothetical protein